MNTIEKRKEPDRQCSLVTSCARCLAKGRLLAGMSLNVQRPAAARGNTKECGEAFEWCEGSGGGASPCNLRQTGSRKGAASCLQNTNFSLLCASRGQVHGLLHLLYCFQASGAGDAESEVPGLGLQCGPSQTRSPHAQKPNGKRKLSGQLGRSRVSIPRTGADQNAPRL